MSTSKYFYFIYNICYNNLHPFSNAEFGYIYQNNLLILNTPEQNKYTIDTIHYRHNTIETRKESIEAQ